ncbi:MAG: serine/threonine protein kinase [Labilithrix sp.]|nr:serine/threonine protein kinase [Labilithrix sp.]MCW5813707.1 serine/threonine protein kinase [Labilithrix sp.]
MRAGDVLGGRYRLERQLGEGGIGVVWAAEQMTTGKKVAIKLLKEEPHADVSRFLREARIVSGLSHPNVVQVFDFWDGREGTPVFMVMELLAGESLADRLRRAGRLAAAETAEIALPIVRALEAAHAAGVVHRDLKPDNVFLAAAGASFVVKVLDFGIAKPTAAAIDQTQLTRTGTVLGTPRYMSPEQVYGEADVDARSDVWSLGCLLYECLVGMTPFDGDNYGQIFRKITERRRVSVRAAVPDAPSSFDALVMRMLAHDRAERPSLADVTRVLGGGAMSLPPLQTSTERLPSLPSIPPPGAPRASRAPLVVVGVVGAAALGGLVWSSRAPAPAPALPEPPAPSVAASAPPPPAISEAPVVAATALPAAAVDAGRSSKTVKKPRPPAPSSAAPDEPPDPLDRGRF